ncbi:MAG TPA: sensor histidine kinase [Thermoleophilaceae bacterium]|jgi:two-component system sensor histidine kinase UhpB|nr:sensor histidine kinase [Thermoleophilaceae bacterium]
MDSASQSRPRYTPLFLRVVAVNAILLVVACVGTLFVIAPHRFSFSSIAAKEVVLVVIVLGAVVILNVALLRHVFTPLERMAALARRFDPRQTGQRVPLSSDESEVTDVARAFNDMLERLEHERRATSRRVLDAQEGERLRVAQDLHDQVGQTLTAALLELEHVAGRLPQSSRPEVEAVQEVVQAGLEDIRRIARELRPEALDDLGLPSALAALTERFARQARIEIDLRVAADLPRLSREAELVIYRVAQEALTNVARHSGSPTAELRLEQTGPDRVSLSVSDAGRGLPPDATAGGGLQGMAERASIVEAALAFGRRDGAGTEIRLDVPIAEEGLWYR